MTYNSFTNRNKLETAKLINQNQTNSISLQDWIQSKINDRVTTSQPKGSIVSNVKWDSEWELMDVKESEAQKIIYKAWSIPLGVININWLPRFNIEIIIKTDEDSSMFVVDVDYYFRKFIGWNITDVEGDELSDFKNITLVASLYSDLLEQPTFEAKLLVRYVNQSCN